MQLSVSLRDLSVEFFRRICEEGTSRVHLGCISGRISGHISSIHLRYDAHLRPTETFTLEVEANAPVEELPHRQLGTCHAQLDERSARLQEPRSWSRPAVRLLTLTRSTTCSRTHAPTHAPTRPLPPPITHLHRNAQLEPVVLSQSRTLVRQPQVELLELAVFRSQRVGDQVHGLRRVRVIADQVVALELEPLETAARTLRG